MYLYYRLTLGQNNNGWTPIHFAVYEVPVYMNIFDLYINIKNVATYTQNFLIISLKEENLILVYYRHS